MLQNMVTYSQGKNSKIGGENMYTIRSNNGKKRIYEVEPVKLSRRGTALWCKFKEFKKHKLISFNKLYENYQEALESLNQ